MATGRLRAAALALSALLIVSLGSPGWAQAPAGSNQGPVTLTADHIEYDTQTGNAVADGHVVATRGDEKITADHLTGNLKTGDVRAAGHVVLTEPKRTVTGDELIYNYKTRDGEMRHGVAKYAPWTMAGQTITTTASRGMVLSASATPCDPAHPAFQITARRVVVFPDDHLTAYDTVLRVYGVPVFYVPVYTVSLKPHAPSGLSAGYDTFDGVWADYTQYVPLGDWEGQFRARLGSRSHLSAEALVDRRFPDYFVQLHLGRAIAFDQNGTQFDLDQNTLEVDLNGHRIGSLPLSYGAQIQAGDIHEIETGASAFRTDGLVTLTMDTIRLTPSLNVSAGGYYRYDSYSTGDVRTILSAAAAMSQTLTQASSVTLSYNFATIGGRTPFAFDGVSPASNLTLSYNYYPSAGLLSSGYVNLTYDYLAQQTSAGLGLVFNVSSTLIFSTTASYNLATRQFTEIDYAVNGNCDCVSFGLVYRTFPNNPAANQWVIAAGINTLPGINTLLKLGGP